MSVQTLAALNERGRQPKQQPLTTSELRRLLKETVGLLDNATGELLPDGTFVVRLLGVPVATLVPLGDRPEASSQRPTDSGRRGLPLAASQPPQSVVVFAFSGELLELR